LDLCVEAFLARSALEMVEYRMVRMDWGLRPILYQILGR
jgi:hypothetical protein